MMENFDITPLAKSEKRGDNSPSRNTLYVTQDYQGFKKSFIEILQKEFANEFNDFTESSLLIALAELYAFMADQLSFKIDQNHSEVYAKTATEMNNIMRIDDMVGLKPMPPMPAKANFVITINHPLTVDLPIETPLKLSFPAQNGMGERYMELYACTNQEPVFGEPIIIPAGAVSANNIIGVEGHTFFRSLNSNGSPWQRFTLAGMGVIHNSVRITVGGVQWREVPAFTLGGSQEFVVEYDSNYSATILFGNGKLGQIPDTGLPISVSYRLGGGTGGNIAAGAIDKTVPIHVAGHHITSRVQNISRGEGGYDGDTIDDIKLKLPLYIRTQSRVVTGSDYKEFCESYGSTSFGVVGKAVSVLRNHGCAANVIDVYVLAKHGGIGLIASSQKLKEALSKELAKRKMFTDHVYIRDGEIIPTDIHINIVAKKIYKRNEADIRQRINIRLADFFSLANWEFGQTLTENDMIKRLIDIKEIDHLDLTFTTAGNLENGTGGTNIITTKFNEIIRPDNIFIAFNWTD
jgi:hypothetical protein